MELNIKLRNKLQNKLLPMLRFKAHRPLSEKITVEISYNEYIFLKESISGIF